MLAFVSSAYPLADTKLPFRRLVLGPKPSPERILIHSWWSKGHNNPRYAELLPRIRRLDPFLIVCSERRIPRGLQYRGLWMSRRAMHSLFHAAANRSYRYMLTADNEQIPYFAGAVVSDTDDPKYTLAEVAQLNSPQLAAYVVTAERAGKRFEQLGVQKPFHVIPQGVSLGSLSEAEHEEIRRKHKDPGQLVFGFMAAFLLTDDDRDGSNPLFNVDHLLELWDGIHDRVPNGCLWLLGEASSNLQKRCAGRRDIRLFGRVSKSSVLSYAANFDVALYPRRVDHVPQAAKVVEYMGAGVPTIAYDYPVVEIISESGAGILVDHPTEFVEAAATLATDPAIRAKLSEAAREAGGALDWDVLARRYEIEVLDRYLTP